MRETSSRLTAENLDHPAHGDAAATADTLNAEGLRLAEAGDVPQAIELFRRATAACPGFATAWQNLGVALAQSGDEEGAAESFKTALALRPEYVEAHLNLGSVLLGLDRAAEAKAAFRRAVELRPTSADALNGLGLALTRLNSGYEASVYLRQAARLRPDFSGAYNNLGLALAEIGDYPGAAAAYDQALTLRPDYAEALANWGNALKEQGRVQEAIACHDLALAYKPNHPSTRWNRALAELVAGNFADGWLDYEARFDRDDRDRVPHFDKPKWNGSPLAGEHVLIWPEQGLGDVVQFIRFAGALKQIGAGRIIAWCPSPLLRMLPTCSDIDEVLPEGVLPRRFDLHVPLMSLPRLLGVGLATLPAAIGYLHPPADRVRYWREQLRSDNRFLVGIVWQGNPHHRWDRHRSVPLAAFAPLAEVPGVQLVSLQRGPGAEQLERWSGPPILTPLARDLNEPDAVAELAALAAAVDLVITVDTLPAHLAGAIGTQTWVLLSTMVDWRWLLDRDDSPWYPSMRLYRQSSRGEWKPVFERVAADLAARVKSAASERQRFSAREPASQTPLLSLCIIARDNAATLPACLASAKPWVDETIVVDTGSLDNTRELASAAGARVFDFPWIDDFAAARNESLRHARGQWIFWIDSDDVIDAENGQRIREMASAAAPDNLLGYVVQVHCPSPSGQDVTVVDHVKLIRNRPDIRFEGRIHEQILPAIRRAGGEVAWSDAFVVHANADRTPEGRRRKLERDMRLLRLDAADRPGHTFVLFNLGMTLADAGLHEEAAARLAESIVAGDPAESHMRKVYALYASCLAELGRHSDALRACLDGLAHYPNDAELNFRAGLTSHRLGRPADAVAFYRDAMRPPAERAFASVDRGISSYKALFNMAAAMLDLGDLSGAENAYREVVRLAPDWELGRRTLADFLAEQKPIELLETPQLREVHFVASTEREGAMP